MLCNTLGDLSSMPRLKPVQPTPMDVPVKYTEHASASFIHCTTSCRPLFREHFSFDAQARHVTRCRRAVTSEWAEWYRQWLQSCSAETEQFAAQRTVSALARDIHPASMPQCLLYKWQPGWGLASISPACLEVEVIPKLRVHPPTLLRYFTAYTTVVAGILALCSN